MATRMQIARLAERIDALAARFAPQAPEPPPEVWITEGDRAWPMRDPEHVINYAELEALPTARTSFPTRMEVRLVHAKNGGPAECCQPGGSCYALHGPVVG
jgi:hypothetical protein